MRFNVSIKAQVKNKGLTKLQKKLLITNPSKISSKSKVIDLKEKKRAIYGWLRPMDGSDQQGCWEKCHRVKCHNMRVIEKLTIRGIIHRSNPIFHILHNFFFIRTTSSFIPTSTFIFRATIFFPLHPTYFPFPFLISLKEMML